MDEDPVKAVRDVLDRMDELLDRWEMAWDTRAIFLRSYRSVTFRVLESIDRLDFEDNEWLRELDVRFARLYFDAVDGFDSGAAELPACWRIAFELAESRRASTLQHLLVGMNAHIRRDLPLALAGMGLAATDRALRLRDHRRVNDVLAELIESVQDEVTGRYSFFLGFFDRLAGNHDEILTGFGLRKARDRAWERAVALVDAKSEADRLRITEAIESDALGAALAIAHLDPFARAFSWAQPLDVLLARLWTRARDKVSVAS